MNNIGVRSTSRPYLNNDYVVGIPESDFCPSLVLACTGPCVCVCHCTDSFSSTDSSSDWHYHNQVCMNVTGSHIGYPTSILKVAIMIDSELLILYEYFKAYGC